MAMTEIKYTLLKIPFITITAIGVLFALLFCRLAFYNNLPFVTAEINQKLYNKDFYMLDTDKQTIKKEIEKIFNHPHYSYEEKTLTLLDGYTNVFTRHITINNNTNIYDYTTTLTHEFIHLTEFVGNERYTNFKTFTTLYNSNNETLKEISIYFAKKNMLLQNSDSYKDYCCWGYISEYFD